MLAGIAGIYLVLAYLILPKYDAHEVHKHPGLLGSDHITLTGTGMPGDPLNISLVGSKLEVIESMAAAGWFPANALSFGSSVRIAVDTTFDRPDTEAPVSSLYLFGQKEDLAFEKPVGHSPRKRHHVRFWQTEKIEEGRPVWIGSAAFDSGVELSRTTGEITHHISGNLDAERDLIVTDLSKATRPPTVQWVDGYQKDLSGRNGGGDPWWTDGRLAVVILAKESS